MLFLCACVILWSFLEASFWWVAPDISISIAYAHFPRYWKRFIVLALAGAFLGSLATYMWAMQAPDAWLQYVSGMRFHSAKNIQYVNDTLPTDFFSIVKGAWGGIPYKLFFGIAPIKDIAFADIIGLGLVSRSVRFLFVLGVTCVIRFYSRPWSNAHPTQFSLLLLSIWAVAITLFDVVINKILV
jgi:membrane protein YqaA with SNARE-associated domain